MAMSNGTPGRPLLIANRGEVAVRIIRAAADLGIPTVGLRASDDPDGAHRWRAGEVAVLPGSGPAAYLDVDALVDAAVRHGCGYLHPGWGFLAESAELAEACEAAGVGFVGPPARVLRLFGDKARARDLARAEGAGVLPGTGVVTRLEDAESFVASLGHSPTVVVKAVAGGGGHGMRIVRPGGDLEAALHLSRSEALAGFGTEGVYLEQYAAGARHIEVQIAADGSSVVQLGERDCSLQRRYQKLIEIAPAPYLDAGTRDEIHDAAIRIARGGDYLNIGTFEFLLAADGSLGEQRFAFIEANPRLQVEHTVTEELLGIDLVALQIRLASGATLAELGIASSPATRSGYAIEARINAETLNRDGSVVPSLGSVTALEWPGGPGVRVDTHARLGYTVDPRFDSLLAKVIVVSRGPSFSRAAAKLAEALEDVRVEGLATNVGLLRRLLEEAAVLEGRVTTSFIDENAGRLASVAGVVERVSLSAATAAGDGLFTVISPMTGVVVAVEVAAGDEVAESATVVIVEAMKMEHLVVTATPGIVRDVLVAPGDPVAAGAVVAVVEEADVAAEHRLEAAVDLDHIRPELADLLERRRLLSDEARPAAVARRHGTAKRTARENIADLCDAGSFEEYGGFAIAAQAARRGRDDLIANTPGDGLVAGIGRVNGDVFTVDASRCAVLSYDYMVLAGTQGQRNHQKKDRLFELVERLHLPVVLFAEGGGGRPGDTDFPVIAGLDTLAFALFGRLSGLVPLVGVVEGRCFAGNAALLGCSDVIIATADSNIGMGGPAMIEGGGLGTFQPEDIGPVDVQAPNGVIDIVVADDNEAVAVAKRYLSYFQGAIAGSGCADQRALRYLVPENRARAYDVRKVVETLTDTASVLEIRRQFGIGIVCCLARIEGRPIGIIANNPAHLGGAIDSPAADKAARFMQLCDAFDIPILFLCDTPGFMVGPDAERSAQVRHFGRMFVTGASLSVPFFTVVLRKGYGLGAQAMAGGSFRSPLFTVSWPTGEFGGMGLEGAVRLSMRRELEAIADSDERDRAFQRLVASAYERGKALNMATNLEIDDVIDPAETRRRILNTLDACPPAPARQGKKRPCIDSW
jgi:acetyl/propionyl-CoA carboxylase alpha subunit/acetyl-CoA carboxylase carboxyltransferase component